MAPNQDRRRWHYLTRAGSLLGTVALSVAATLFVQHLTAPPPVTAQTVQAPAQSGEVRAASFVLVGPDGGVLARLGPGSSGNGNLTLFDASGRLRIALSGSGDLLAYGSGGTALAQIFANADTDNSGLFLRDSDGKLRVSVGQTTDMGSAAVQVDDPGGKLRVGIGTLADESGGNSGNYGLRVRDGSGGILTTVP